MPLEEARGLSRLSRQAQLKRLKRRESSVTVSSSAKEVPPRLLSEYIIPEVEHQPRRIHRSGEGCFRLSKPLDFFAGEANIILKALGNSVMVALAALDRPVLVRIQVPQPIF